MLHTRVGIRKLLLRRELRYTLDNSEPSKEHIIIFTFDTPSVSRFYYYVLYLFLPFFGFLFLFSFLLLSKSRATISPSDRQIVPAVRREGSERKRSGASTGPVIAGPPTSLRRRASRATT